MRGSRSKTLVRGWYGVVAGLVAVALIGQLILLARDHDSLVNYFSYFTIESNIVVLVMSVMIVVDPERDDFLSQIVRLAALTAITITGVVYGTLIGPFVNPSGAELRSPRSSTTRCRPSPCSAFCSSARGSPWSRGRLRSWRGRSSGSSTRWSAAPSRTPVHRDDAPRRAIRTTSSMRTSTRPRR